MSYDLLNARALLPDPESSELPPLLYLSAEADAPASALLPLLTHLGLTPVTLSVDGGLATLDFYQAQGEQWLVGVGAGGGLEVHCPDPGGGHLLLLSEVTISDPPTWCDEALRREQVLLFAGPPLTWRHERPSLSQVLSTLGRRAACAGVVPVRPLG